VTCQGAKIDIKKLSCLFAIGYDLMINQNLIITIRATTTYNIIAIFILK